MGRVKIEKCHVGYIQQQKKINWVWLAVFIVIGLAIFYAGYLWSHTRANVFTVLAILMVLPAAKRVVALVVFMPRKGVSAERFDAIREKAGGGTLFAEYVFTSTEKIMHLDFLLFWKEKAIAVTAPSIQDREYMTGYLEENVHRIASDYEVLVFDRDEELLAYLDQNKGGGVSKVKKSTGKSMKPKEETAVGALTNDQKKKTQGETAEKKKGKTVEQSEKEQSEKLVAHMRTLAV